MRFFGLKDSDQSSPLVRRFTKFRSCLATTFENSFPFSIIQKQENMFSNQKT